MCSGPSRKASTLPILARLGKVGSPHFLYPMQLPRLSPPSSCISNPPCLLPHSPHTYLPAYLASLYTLLDLSSTLSYLAFLRASILSCQLERK